MESTGTTTELAAADAAEPMESATGPLGKPPGTVRAYLAGAIVAAFLVGHLGGALLLLRAGALESGLALLGALAVEAGTVTGFYFGVRQGSG